MKTPPLPDNESDRLKALAEYAILDTLPEDVYDDITRIASEISGTPIALLTLVDENRQWFKSKQGFEVNETPREYSFCAHAIINPNEMMIVEDARYDERFHDNPLTTGETNVVFYAGVPIVEPGGHALGTLCIIDNRPRNLPENKLLALKALAKLVNAHFELRKTKLELERLHQELNRVNQGNVAPQPAIYSRTEPLVRMVDNSLQALMAANPRPDQASLLDSIKQTIQALKTTLAEENH